MQTIFVLRIHVYLFSPKSVRLQYTPSRAGCQGYGVNALLLPWVPALAAGAMVYVVIDNIVPAACQGKPTAPVAAGTLAGFVLMMILDVAVG
ncbi:MAG: hypothetical protein LBM78_05055 [Clostridiales bacterium]|nr:hypothetical protein [Clostridiales bacterium]